MDPLYEQRLRDEVIYLHSLWRQGPPRAAAAAPVAVARHHLQPSKATKFKKQKKPRRKSGKISTNSAPESNSSAGAEWPCPASPPLPSTTGWPSFEPSPNPQPPLLSPEEQSKLAAKQVQKKALKVVREFFASNNADDSDAIDSSSDEDDEYMEEDYVRDLYSFFFSVFEEDTELKEYYENNFTKGEFSCLVCGAVGGKKTLKKFKGCLPLVQHSITIANTKRRAHRAFGQAVCKVLGWDIDHLPAIVSMLSDKSSEEPGNGSSDNKESSMTLVNNVDSLKNDALEGKIEEAARESGYLGSGISSHGDEGDMTSLTCPDADKNQNLGIVYQHTVEQPAPEGLTINSVTWTGADRNWENLGVIHPHNVEDTAVERLRNVQMPQNNNNHVGNEIQDL